MRISARLLTASLLLAASTLAARADTFSFFYSYSGVTASGIFTATAESGGQYLVTDVSGERNGITITGVAPVGSGGVTDNLLFPDQTVPVDFDGITYLLASGDEINLFASDIVAPGFSREYIINLDDEEPVDAGFTVTITPTTPIAATPEPSTFALLGTGILGLGGIARRRFFRT